MVGVGGSNPLATTKLVGVRVDENHRFDKFVGNEFERPQDGPKGGRQDAWNNPLATTKPAFSSTILMKHVAFGMGHH
jgi:hypothetical protein